MKEWRPEGFENPYTPDLEQTEEYLDHGARDQSIFEDGADAMLAALRGKVHEETRLSGNPHIDGEWVYVEMRAEDIKGWSVVFVPDKE